MCTMPRLRRQRRRTLARFAKFSFGVWQRGFPGDEMVKWLQLASSFRIRRLVEGPVRSPANEGAATREL